MKVILLETVPSVGKAGEVKDVSDGYGRNYLIPRKLAVKAQVQDVKALEAQIKAKAKLEAQLEAEAQKLGELIDGTEITINARVGQNDRLYGSVTAADIAEELEKVLETTIDKRKVELENPIRELGNFEVTVKLGKEILPKVKVTITEEEK